MKWLLFDCNSLCHAARHTTGDLDNGVIFGFLKQVLSIQHKFGTYKVVFCWDHGKPIRESIFPAYKSTRRSVRGAYSEEQRAKYVEHKQQMELLKEELLERIGFRNVHYRIGYEADDIIAEIARFLDTQLNDKSIVVSGDKDLLQCITRNVSFYNTHKHAEMDFHQFRKEYGIEPKDWPRVKAMCGDKSDDIPGIGGVGETTAIKFLKKKLSWGCKAHQTIMHPKSEKIIERNLKLVKLPFDDSLTEEFPLVDDEVTRKRWRKVAAELDIQTMQAPTFKRIK